MEILYSNIAIEGNIGSGKTTLAQNLSNSLNGRLILESFENNPFLELFYSDTKRYAFQVEMFFLAERYHQLSKNLLGDIFHKQTISDYMFSKSAIFSGINLDSSEHALFLSLYRIMERFMPRPDILFYIHHPIEVVIGQIKKRGRNYERAIDESYLQQIEKAYMNWMKEESRFPVIILENRGSRNLSPERIEETILDFLQQEWPKGMTYTSI